MIKLHEELESKIKTKTAKIGVIGLGYVGLPLAKEFSESEYSVKGFDVDQYRVDLINGGASYIEDVPVNELKPLVDTDYLSATTNFTELGQMDVIFICVPTPFTETKDPDLTYIKSATEEVSKNLNKNQLIILESTTYPGTTEEVVLPILKQSGLTEGKDFYLAFSPERVDPGNKKFGISNTPKVVGGITETCTELAAKLYDSVIESEHVHKVSNPSAAELTKLLENTFRSVNIALVNELSLLCKKMGIDVWEVIDAAATKPFGYMPFYPGPGVGGHCIPVDPYYLSWKAREYDFNTRFIQLSADINNQMPLEVVNMVSDQLNNEKKPVNGANILVIGAAFKKDVSDVRNSTSLVVMDHLNNKGANLFYYDPYVSSINFNEHHEVKYSKDLYLESIKLNNFDLNSIDSIVLMVDHTDLNLEILAESGKPIVDTKNVFKDYETKANVIKI